MYHQIYPSTNYLNINKYGFSYGFLTKDIVDKYKQLCLKSKENKIKNNSVIYPSPLSNYPGYKLDNYISENKLSIKKSYTPSKIDTIILDENLIDTLRITDYTTEYIIIPALEFKKYYTSLIDKESQIFLSKKVNDSDFLYIHKKGLQHNQNFKNTFNDYPVIVGGLVNARSRKTEKIIELIKSLFDYIEKYKWYVVLDNNINSETNKDLIINQEMFENLYSMLSSEDKGNEKLAREIIANCNYEISKPFILFLASEFSILLNKSDNVNYHITHKSIIKDFNKAGTRVWDIKNNHYKAIKDIIKCYPEYRNDIAKCLKTRNNHYYECELIKEVIPG